jgi:hypothetical protein
MSKPNYDDKATWLIQRLSHMLSATEQRDVISAQLALAYQEGFCDGLGECGVLVNDAFAKHGGGKP